jgi:hypothetical protein
MLNDEIKKKCYKTNPKKGLIPFGLVFQTSNSGHEIKITSYKTNK